MGRKRGGTVLMALGVVLALISGLVVFFVTQTATAAPPEVPTRDVVVARIEIRERTRITPDMLQIAKIPENVIPPGTFTTIEDVTGKWAKENVHVRTAVIGTVLAVTDESVPAIPAGAAPAGGGPLGGGAPPPPKLIDAAYTLEPGKTMVAVSYPEAAKLASAGILRAGNKVDIYVKAPGLNGDQMALIFSNMEIKAIGDLNTGTKDSAAKDAAPSATLIFITTPQDALVLKFLESMNPFLLLRAAGDDQVIKTDLVTQDYIAARFGLQRIVVK